MQFGPKSNQDAVGVGHQQVVPHNLGVLRFRFRRTEKPTTEQTVGTLILTSLLEDLENTWQHAIKMSDEFSSKMSEGRPKKLCTCETRVAEARGIHKDLQFQTS